MNGKYIDYHGNKCHIMLINELQECQQGNVLINGLNQSINEKQMS